MNEDKLFKVLNNLDDDLMENEIDKLMEGIELDSNSIKEKAYNKLNNKKKNKFRKRLPYVAAACVCVLGISTVYGKDISQAVKAFFNKTPVYSTVVDGEAYYLKGNKKLNDKITVKSIIMSTGKLEMELITKLDLEKIGDIKITPKNDKEMVYAPAGMMDQKDGAFYSFGNKKQQNYDIKSCKDIKLTIDGKTYDISLDKAGNVDSNIKTYENDDIKGVYLGAKRINKDGKTNIQIITGFDDKNLELSSIGKPIMKKVIDEWEDLGKEKGIRGSGTSSSPEDIYAFDDMNNKYKLRIPKDATGRPITIFETDIPKDKSISLNIPSIVMKNSKSKQSYSLQIPDNEEKALNKEINFGMQSIMLEKIKKTSANSVELEAKLDTNKDNDKINVRAFSVQSKDIRKVYSEFKDGKAIIKIDFKENIKSTDVEFSYPEFEVKGDWKINID